MNPILKRWIFAVLWITLFIHSYIPYAFGSEVRMPILAGTWYPGDKAALLRSTRDFLSKAHVRKLKGDLKAIVVPHAGHLYSGQTAAHAYRLLQGMDIQRVILIGPSHRIGFKGVSVDMHSGYMTPIGMVPEDLLIAKQLIHASEIIRNVPEAHSQEHSLEIQLPFLQAVLKNFQIIPVIMGEQDFGTCTDLADTLIKITGPLQKTLILASSDLSHFHSDKQARELDMEFIRHIQAMDPNGLWECLSSRKCEACGGGPVITTLLTAKALGANQAEILGYSHSGDITGDNNRVVGYVSAAFIITSDTGPHP